MINIQVIINSRLLDLNNEKVTEILTHTLKSENIKNGEIAIIFVSEAHIKKLKNRFFSTNQATDVIAFRLNNYNDINIEGEIYICGLVAKANANYYNVPFEKEIARLIIHGGLHLIGYLDRTKIDKDLMHQKENKYLKELGY